MKVFSSFDPQTPPFKRIKNYVYNPSNLLGAGNFSKVYSGRHESTGTPSNNKGEIVAIKVVELESLKTAKL
jgi:serine/threonine protein kinase